VRRRRPSGTNEPGRAVDIGWAALAYLFAGLATALLLVAALPPAPDEVEAAAPDPTAPVADPGLRSLLEQRTLLARQWSEVLAELCSHPKLEAEEMAPDCATGSLVIADELFDRHATAQLSEEGMRKLQIALPVMLAELRSSELVWKNLDAIELRGHADPRAEHDPYVTNLVGSRQRPLGIALYLVAEWTLDARDRDDLKRLMVVSAASHSRPPEGCPDATRECYPYWRRVEIIPVLREAPLRDELMRLRSELAPQPPERS
jgi:hypothetical protein